MNFKEYVTEATNDDPNSENMKNLLRLFPKVISILDTFNDEVAKLNDNDIARMNTYWNKRIGGVSLDEIIAGFRKIESDLTWGHKRNT